MKASQIVIYALMPLLFLFACTSNPDIELEQREVQSDSTELIDREITDENDKDSMTQQAQYLPSDYNWIKEENEDFVVSPEGEDFALHGDSIASVKLFMCIESSISIMDEGKHCDLDQWTHGYSDWVELKNKPNYKIADLKYTLFVNPTIGHHDQKLFFPIEDMEIIKKKVRAHCGEFYANHIKNCQTPFDYPCGVLPSAFLFKAEYTLKNGKSKTGFIKLPNPMGC